MLYSMTGFGKGTAEGSYGKVAVEIKSVNSKGLDLSVKLPRELSAYEDIVKNAIQSKLARGKVDAYVTFVPGEKLTPVVEVNYTLAKAYYDAQKKVSEELGIDDKSNTGDLFRMSDVFKVTTPEADEKELGNTVKDAVTVAVNNIVSMRATEGANLEKVLKEILENIKAAFANIKARAPYITVEYRDKLRERIQQLLGNENVVDEQRLAQEVAFFADKSNIDEEMSRIDSHLSQLTTLLEGGLPVGRELDFIVQEFKREINTLGCKSNDSELFANVLTVKGELEKFREQIQNIE